MLCLLCVHLSYKNNLFLFNRALLFNVKAMSHGHYMQILTLCDTCMLYVMHKCFLRSSMFPEVHRGFRPTGLYVNSALSCFMLVDNYTVYAYFT